MSELDEDRAREVGALVAGNLPALSNEEIRAVLEKMRDEQLRHVFLALVERMRTLEKPLRLEAERDGWKEIATTLLKVAFGDDANYPVPPIELLELAHFGEIDEGGYLEACERCGGPIDERGATVNGQRQCWSCLGT